MIRKASATTILAFRSRDNSSSPTSNLYSTLAKSGFLQRARQQLESESAPLAPHGCIQPRMMLIRPLPSSFFEDSALATDAKLRTTRSCQGTATSITFSMFNVCAIYPVLRMWLTPGVSSTDRLTVSSTNDFCKREQACKEARKPAHALAKSTISLSWVTSGSTSTIAPCIYRTTPSEVIVSLLSNINFSFKFSRVPSLVLRCTINCNVSSFLVHS
jgi:hypothetical protein